MTRTYTSKHVYKNRNAEKREEGRHAMLMVHVDYGRNLSRKLRMIEQETVIYTPTGYCIPIYIICEIMWVFSS